MGVVRGLMRVVVQRWLGGPRLVVEVEGTAAKSGAETGTEAEAGVRNPGKVNKDESYK